MFDLISAVSVPDKILADLNHCDYVQVTVRNRETGQKDSCVSYDRTPWGAICIGLLRLTKVPVPDQPHSRDSLSQFAASAMIDVNRELAKQEAARQQKEAKGLDFIKDVLGDRHPEMQYAGSTTVAQ